MEAELHGTINSGRKIGALVGGVLFLVFGLVPAFYFGSFGTLVLLSHLSGGAVEVTIITRIVMVVGIMLGIFCVGAVSIVMGAVSGTVLGYVVDVLAKAKHHNAEMAAQTPNNPDNPGA